MLNCADALPGGLLILDELQNIKQCILNVLKQSSKEAGPRSGTGKQFQSRPLTFHYHKAHDVDQAPAARRRTELLYSLMDTYIKNDVLSIQKSIVDHVEYTVARSRYKFDDFEAYQVRTRRLERTSLCAPRRNLPWTARSTGAASTVSIVCHCGFSGSARQASFLECLGAVNGLF